jgi:uncharacterized DUF497 family protein
VRFEWDRAKGEANLRKHGVSFEEAAGVFFDPLSVTIPDPDHSVGEGRFLTLGVSTVGRVLVVSHTERSNTLRIISARLASASERRRHEK